MDTKSCIFCQRGKIIQDILYETGNFFVKVGFGLIAPGHVMVISRNHYPCFAAMPDRLLREYEAIKSWVIARISRRFAWPFLIEYGVWGQTVFHAHTHFIPSRGPGYRIDSIVRQMFAVKQAHLELVNWKRLQDIYRAEQSYVYVEDNDSAYVSHVYDVPDDPSIPHLNYRTFFADNLGLPGVGDWQTMSKRDKISDERKRNTTKAIFGGSVESRIIRQPTRVPGSAAGAGLTVRHWLPDYPSP